MIGRVALVLALGLTPHHLVSSQALAMATRVAVCEEGGWHNVDGPTYFGALGWLWSTWQMFRTPSFPVNMANASPEQQAWALERFVRYYHMAMPDQIGCTGGY